MPYSRSYVNNAWTAGPKVPVPDPAPAPAPAPSPFAPATGLQDQQWWKTRGGHELYGIFDRIYKENPMAGIAFWNAVVGTGRGMNDLSAATIHKMFGGDMNAFSNWRNLYHYNSLDSSAGMFDLAKGTWTPSQAFNPQYVKDRTGWDISGPWQANWNWGDYQNTLKTGLQSTPGHEDDGSEAWKTYLWGAKFGPNGVEYPSVYEQAVGSGLIPPPRPSGPVPKLPAKPGGVGTPVTFPTTPGPAVGPAIATPPPAGGTNTPSTPVAPAIPSPTNPGGAPRTYQYRTRTGAVR